MPRIKKEHASSEALPDRGPELVRWFDNELPRRTEHYTIEKLSRVVTTGGNKDLLRRALLGSGKKPRPLKLIEAVRLANELEIPLVELLTQFGFELKEAALPVWGRVSPEGVISKIKNPVSVPAPPIGLGALAVEVSAPGPWQHGIAFYQRSRDRAPYDIGRLVVAKPTGAASEAMGVLSETTKGFALAPLGGAPPIRVSGLEWSFPILWLRCR